MNEFELIARYFTRPARARRGIGDDCALIAAGDRDIAVTTDMLVEQVHFLSGVDPEALGHKALAVNLSDLAATAAAPRCFFLSLALPGLDEAWLAAFARGLFALADRHACELLGGDTVRTPDWRGGTGPLTISITALGDVERGRALGRDGARPGDDVWVSGTLGDAWLGLQLARGDAAAGDGDDAAFFRGRMERPTPRVELGVALRGIATAAIDVSDGLLGDLGHILERSGVGARVDADVAPRSSSLKRQAAAVQRQAVLAGGDDYELAFTAGAADRARLLEIGRQVGVPLTRIGVATVEAGLAVVDAAGRPLELPARGFDHFAA